MFNIFLFGINGKMGKAVKASCERLNTSRVCGGFDLVPAEQNSVFSEVSKINVPYDVVIDFSRPETLDSIKELTKKNPRPVVLATTGYSENQLVEIKELSSKIPVFMSGNMSFGVNVMLELVSRASELLFDSFDIEVIEKHHNQKVDAPSGTAKMIANAINAAAEEKAEFIYGRHGSDCKRKAGDIGIHAVRGGTIIGEHEAIFAGNDEIITISHTALSRNIFADGALKAAQFILNKPAGLYNMKDLLK